MCGCRDAAPSQCTWLSSPASSLPTLPLLQPEALSDLCRTPSTPTQLPAGWQYPSVPTPSPFPPASVHSMILHTTDKTHCPSHFCGKCAGFPSLHILHCLRGSWRHSSVMPSLLPPPTHTWPPCRSLSTSAASHPGGHPVFRGKLLHVWGKKTE